MSRCFFSGPNSLRLKESLRSCGGRVQWHHPLEKDWLKRHFKYGAIRTDGGDLIPATRHEAGDPMLRTRIRTRRAILTDTRNRVFICWRHHDLIGQHTIKLTRDDLPESVEEFAREYGLVARLERDFGERKVTA